MCCWPLPGRSLPTCVRSFSSARACLPIIVFDLNQRGNILRAVQGEAVGTLVTADAVAV